MADEAPLTQVFQNLISNSVKYTRDGEIRVEAHELADGAVECFVSDNGSGIPEERIEKVFEKLETDPEKPGTGLGLAIVKKVVEAHGGHVEVESKLGEGATFRFTLPKMNADRKPA
ncbi:MAG: HAMP domain-containing sensor histidine kinase, partial [Acidobacteriota bacterium]